MIKFTLEGLDSGLHMIRLTADNSLHRLNDDQYTVLLAGGELPMVDAPYPDPDPGPGLHPISDVVTGKTPQAPAEHPPKPQV